MIKTPIEINALNELGFNVMAIRYNEIDLVAAELLSTAAIDPELANSFEYQSVILKKHGLSLSTMDENEINYLIAQLGG
jgi:hypothetical protein